jgi:hypothetical protein
MSQKVHHYDTQMRREMKNSTLLVLVLAMLLIGGCNSQPPLTPAEAIKLAKAAAAELQSPPRVYNAGDTSHIRSWPDVPGSKVVEYNSCGGDVCSTPITFTTIVTPSSGGSEIDVTFISSWLERGTAGRAEAHRWLFHVNNDRHVDFIREEGDKLPEMPG